MKQGKTISINRFLRAFTILGFCLLSAFSLCIFPDLLKPVYGGGTYGLKIDYLNILISEKNLK